MFQVMKPLTVGLLSLALIASGASAMPLVVDNQPRAVIVVADDASKQLRDAALVLQKYVRQSTGAQLPIHIGRSAYTDAQKLEISKLDGDGFVLKGIDAKSYVITGPTDWGTEFGVYEFLERYLGVRWLFPTEDGTHVPQKKTLDVPDDEVRQQPAYWSRQVYPIAESWKENTSFRGAAAEWGRRNRLHTRIEFHHNLKNLFPVSKYGQTHPEFYPLVDGKRYIPKDDKDFEWQPNFTAPGIVEEAARNIKQYFKDHPEATSYSLGMNDSRRFDESPATVALDGDKKNYLGIGDVSNSYFTWANAVVTEVLKEYPDKWFGTLAYSRIAEPPTKVKPHPRIVPFITYDRMKWIEPEIAKQGKELTLRWTAASPVVGWYDYAYGAYYQVPRVYPHQMQNYFKWGAQNGVGLHFSELIPTWGEGPKSWIYLKLQWNPNQNVDALLDDWYTAAVGEKAAPKLREYYAIWEKFWTTTAIKSKWFTPDGQYLRFTTAEYLADVDPNDIKRSRQLMNEVMALAQTPQQKKRAGVLGRAWDFYEASALSYRTEIQAQTMLPRTEEEALKLLDEVPNLAMTQRRNELLARMQDRNHPDAATDYSLMDLGYAPALRGERWGSSLLFNLLPWVPKSEKVRQRLEALTHSQVPVVREQAAFTLLVASGKAVPVTNNPSFELGTLSAGAATSDAVPEKAVGDAAFGWTLWKIKDEKGTFALSNEQAHSGKRSLRVDKMGSGAPTQHAPFAPGRYYAIAHVLAPETNKTEGTFSLVVQAIKPNGGWVGSDQNGRFEAKITPKGGMWQSVVVPFEIKEEQRVTIKTLQLIVGVGDWGSDSHVFVDDAAIYKIP
jgi:hypothetical protein